MFALPLLISGCADSSYYRQSVSGHLQMMQAARPVAQWLSDESATPGLKHRLELAQRIRRFAVSDLHLPDNATFSRYADLHRRSALWNVVAAPQFSLALKTWCFPIAGCVGYRGYFSEAAAQAQARTLQDNALEVSVYGVPAYSTLGWLNWAGGDPLLSTFIDLPEGELARMMFHELAHQVLYVKDDTLFNESFASTVERLGGERWLRLHGSQRARQEDALRDARRQQFRRLSAATRSRLDEIYKQNTDQSIDRPSLLAMKRLAMKEFRESYLELKTSWGGYAGYDAWVDRANNAAFGAQAAYDDWVPAFTALFDREDQDWPRFFDAVKRLAQQPAAERAQTLRELSTEPTHG